MKHSVFVLLSFVIFLSCSLQNKYANNSQPLEEIITTANISKEHISVLVDKSKFSLQLWADTIFIKEYPVVLGGNPKGDKLMEGDQRTPEGLFTVRAKYPHKSWSKFIWIDYPNEKSWEKHNNAKAYGKIPKDANIGGEIGIHGVPKGMDFLITVGKNWTLGCISLKNKDINEIYPFISEKTIVEIRP